jgi:hypothetical protein
VRPYLKVGIALSFLRESYEEELDSGSGRPPAVAVARRDSQNSRRATVKMKGGDEA